jgi:hypothetical protein
MKGLQFLHREMCSPLKYCSNRSLEQRILFRSAVAMAISFGSEPDSLCRYNFHTDFLSRPAPAFGEYRHISEMSNNLLPETPAQSKVLPKAASSIFPLELLLLLQTHVNLEGLSNQMTGQSQRVIRLRHFHTPSPMVMVIERRVW